METVADFLNQVNDCYASGHSRGAVELVVTRRNGFRCFCCWRTENYTRENVSPTIAYEAFCNYVNGRHVDTIPGGFQHEGPWDSTEFGEVVGLRAYLSNGTELFAVASRWSQDRDLMNRATTINARFGDISVYAYYEHPPHG